VDQVGEQRHRSGQGEDRELRAGREPEDGEADCDRSDTGLGANDGAVDESVRVAVLATPVVVLIDFVAVIVRVVSVVAQDASLMRSA